MQRSKISRFSRYNFQTYVSIVINEGNVQGFLLWPCGCLYFFYFSYLIIPLVSSYSFLGPNAGNFYIGRETLGDTLTDVWRTDLTQSHGFMAVMHVSVKDCLLMTEIDYGTIQGGKFPFTKQYFFKRVLCREFVQC